MKFDFRTHFRIHSGYLSAVLLFSLLSAGCSTQTADTKTPVDVPVEQPEQNTEPEPEKPVVSEPEISVDLRSLRDAVAQKQPDSIRTAAHEIIDRNAPAEERAEALRALSELAVTSNNLAEARIFAEKAEETLPNQSDTLLLLARIAHADNRNDDAIRYLNAASQTAPENSRSFAMKAAILLSFLDTERALEAAQKAHDIDSNDCLTNIIYADALYASHKFTEASESYESADTRGCSLSETALQNMAKLYEVHVQSPQKACAAYQRLTDLAPDNPYYKASRDYQCAAGNE